MKDAPVGVFKSPTLVGLASAMLALGASLAVVGCANSSPERGPTQCSDGIDNDGDGRTDCEESYCARLCFQVCTSYIDNDNNGLAGCDDPACAEQPCWEPVEVCGVPGDENRNGLEECDDPACAEHEDCIIVLPEECSSGVDEDHDGRIDCDDPDCSNDFEHCPWEICENELDDDGNGDTDCEDRACRHPCGLVEICDSGIDEDQDGDVDCEDDECKYRLPCIDGCNDSGVGCGFEEICVCREEPNCPKDGTTLEEIGDFLGVVDLCEAPSGCLDGGTCRSVTGTYTLRLSYASYRFDGNFIDWPELWVELNGDDLTGIRETFEINCDDCYTVAHLEEGGSVRATLYEQDFFQTSWSGACPSSRHSAHVFGCGHERARHERTSTLRNARLHSILYHRAASSNRLAPLPMWTDDQSVRRIAVDSMFYRSTSYTPTGFLALSLAFYARRYMLHS